MQLKELVEASDRIAATRARNEKIDILAGVLRRLAPEEIEIGVAYLSGHLRQGRVGLGGAAIERALGDEPERIDTLPLFEGIAAARPAPRAPVTVVEVDAAFEAMATHRGSGATVERTRALRRLFERLERGERDFLIRLLVGELRQGALGGIMEEAVARAAEIPLSEVRRAAMLSGNLEAVAVAALAHGLDGVRSFRLVLFRPLQPMLAQSAEDLHDALDRLGEAVLEYKLDGARVQIHRAADDVRVYSRQLNEVTEAVPEIVEAVRALPIGEAILDGEVIALRSDQRPHPFQTTMRRFGRRLEVEQRRAELPLTLFLFDALRLEGRDIFDAPLLERSRELRARAPALSMTQRVTGDLAIAEAFFDASLARGHEGIMAKAPGSPYEAGSRGYAWLKVKTAHTLDLVVLAAEWGHGRRSGRLSNLHLGALDPASGEFVMLGKTFKGLTDELLAWQTQEFPKRALGDDGHVMRLRPDLVVEIAFDDVQQSPRYPAGMALRLARVKRFRPDKRPSEADTIDTVRAIFEGQRPKRRH